MPDQPIDREFVIVDPDDALPPEESSTSARSTTRRLRAATIVSARVVVGLVAVAVAAATVAAATLLPLPAIRDGVPSVVVTPVPTALQAVCPGGLLRLADAEGLGASKASAIGRPDVVAASTGSAVTRTPFASSDAGTGGTPTAPQALSALPLSASVPALIAGAQSQRISTPDFFGLASASCTGGTTDVWLDGGSTTVGRTSLLTLANPTEVPATVDVAVFGENGQIRSPGMTGILVPAGGQRVLSLAGFAPNLVSPVVHVTSRGGQVVADVQQSTVRGLEPGGVDFVGAQSALTTTTVIPGVVLANSVGVQGRLGESGFDDLETVVRVFRPGSKDTSARISVLPEDGKSTGTAFGITIAAGKVTDLPLDTLNDGSYTIVITSRAPIAAAARVSTVGTTTGSTAGASAADSSSDSAAPGPAPTDFAWLAAADRLSGRALFSVAPAPTSATASVLHLQNPTDRVENVVLHPVIGTSQSITLAPGSAAAVPVASGGSYQLSGFRALYAAVTTTSNGGVTGYTVSAPQKSSGPLRVYAR